MSVVNRCPLYKGYPQQGGFTVLVSEDQSSASWTQDVIWTYIRRLIYFLDSGGEKLWQIFPEAAMMVCEDLGPNSFTERHSDRYQRKSASKSIDYMIKHDNFQLYRAYSDRVVWKKW